MAEAVTVAVAHLVAAAARRWAREAAAAATTLTACVRFARAGGTEREPL